MDLAQYENAALNGTDYAIVNQGRDSVMLCDGSVTISFWNDAAAAYKGSLVVPAPGGTITCAHQKMRLVTSGAVAVRVVPAKQQM